MVAPSQGGRENLARGRIDPVAVEVDKLEIAVAGHPANGVDVAHFSSIGRLRAEIEPEFNCFEAGNWRWTVPGTTFGPREGATVPRLQPIPARPAPEPTARGTRGRRCPKAAAKAPKALGTPRSGPASCGAGAIAHRWRSRPGRDPTAIQAEADYDEEVTTRQPTQSDYSNRSDAKP